MSDLQDNCGVFGLSSNSDCKYDIYQGIDFLQHRGQEYCGISTFHDGVRQVTHYGKVGNSFTDEDLSYLKGNRGIGHVSLWERQPVMFQSSLGEIAVAFSGNIVNVDELIQEMMSRGKSFYKRYNVELIAKIIMEAGDPITGLSILAEKVKGAYSVVVLTRDGIYAARDVYGFRPFILGRGQDRCAVSSESRALQNLDMELVRDVAPGEILLITDKGFQTVKQLDSPRRAYCAFEWAYNASIDSVIEGVYVQEARNNIGAKLAQRDLEEGGIKADIVSPVPMSGIGHAIGYHMQSKISYQEVFLYNRYADRSYTLSSQIAREKMAKRKLSVLQSAVKGKRIILVDDSIVRGTQIRYKVRDLKKAGAREVHVRIACPPLMYTCDFGISTKSAEELMARQYMSRGDIASMEQLREFESWIAEQIGADSLKFNSLQTFVEALNIPRSDLCLKCWNGDSPMPLS